MASAREQRVEAAAVPRLRPVQATVDVSVIVVTWNSEHWIGRCLASLPAACEGVSYEVIVHDNRSEDATLLAAKPATEDQDLIVLASETNLGFAGGINRSLERVRGEYVLLLNPDCEMTAGSVRILVDRLEAQPSMAAAVPLLLDENGEPQRDFQLRRFPTFKSLAAEILLFKALWPENEVSAHYHCRDLDITREQAIEQPAAAAMLLRKKVIDEIGPFDERFLRAWFEDVDYCRRLSQAGHEIHLIPAATAVHSGGASLDYVHLEEFLTLWYSNLLRYAAKWLSRREAEALRWFTIVGLMARGVSVATGISRRPSRWSVAKAYFTAARKAFSRWDDPSLSF